MLTNTERQQIVEEVNAGTYGIDEALDDIAAAQKGEEVRKALYAEALVLNREGHAGSTDMIARQQVANLQTSVNGQISTLRTEVGEDIDDLETALNSGLATQNGKIAAQDATIANVVANYNVEYGSTELWASTGETGALAAGTTVTLSEDVSHFDYIDIYSFCGNSNVLDTVPVDAKLQSNAGYALRWVNLSDPGSGSYKAYVRIVETRLHIIGTTLTIDHQVTYRNGEEVNISGAEVTQSNRSTYMGELGIMKVVGRKITANTEVEDIRTGADGTTYNSAGAAVRGQITEVKAQIPLIDASLATAGKAADAKVTGDAVTALNGRLDEQEEIVNKLNEGGLDIKDDVIEAQITDWLNDHPEATTTVQDGSLSMEKFTDGVASKILEAGTKNKQDNSFRFNLDTMPSVSTIRKIKEGLKYFSESDDYVYLQGACFNPSTHRIYIVVPKKDYSDCKIIEISISSYGGAYAKMQEATFSNLGHGNDMTYNSKTDRLCVINGNKIVVINPSTLETESENTIEQDMTSIAYDETQNVFYCHTAMSLMLVVNADDYSTVAKYATDISSRVMFSTQMFVGQGGFLYGNYFVRIYVKTPTTDRAGYQVHYLVFMKKSTGEIDYVLPLWSENGNTEIEAGWQDRNRIVLVAGGGAFSVFLIDADTENIHEIRTSYYYGFEQLSNGANLDNRVINGHWITGSDSETQSIFNIPPNVAGSISLDVRQHGMSFVRQNLVDAKDEMFTRLWTNANDGWTEWTRLLTSKNVTIEAFNSCWLIDFKPLKTYMLFGRYATTDLTWSDMHIAGKMTQQLSFSLPEGYYLTSYASNLTCGTGGMFITPEGVFDNKLRFRILTLHNEPTAHDIKVFFVAKYS